MLQEKLVLDAIGFDIHNVTLLEKGSEKGVTYEYDGKKLTVQLGKTIETGEEYEVKIDYTAKPNETGRGGHPEGKGLYFINPDGKDDSKPQQLWTLGQPNNNSCWFPTIDAPNQRCTQEVFVTVNNKFKTFSNGVLRSSKMVEQGNGLRTDYWHLDRPHAPYLCVLTVGEFKVVDPERAKEEIPVRCYAANDQEEKAKKTSRRTKQMIKFFQKKLRYPFPWPAYNQVFVRDFPVGAMENTTAVVLQDSILDLNMRQRDEVIAHELCHHWFGNLGVSWP